MLAEGAQLIRKPFARDELLARLAALPDVPMSR